LAQVILAQGIWIQFASSQSLASDTSASLLRTMARVLFLLSMVSVAAALKLAEPHPDEFMSAKAGSVPALQPSEVFDEDFPVDMVKLTPHELRYKAQADYARAIAMLKRERAEAEAAQHEMELALKRYQDALAAAKRAKLQAEDALKNKDKYAAAHVDASALAKSSAAEKDAAEAVAKKEQSDLTAAEKAYKDALVGTENSQAKIDALKAKQAEMDKKIAALEAESAEMGHTLNHHEATADQHQSGVAGAKQDVAAASAAADAKMAEAAAAKKAAEEKKAAVAKAEAAVAYANKDKAVIKDEIAAKQKDYDDAEARWMREQADVEIMQKQVARAKAELAKYEEKSGASMFAMPSFIVVASLFYACY